MEVTESIKFEVFIDETYQVASQARLDTFYFLCAISLPINATKAVRQKVLQITGGEVWHSTEEFRTPSGRAKFKQLLNLISGNARCFVFTKIPLTAGDKLGESSRAFLMRKLISHQVEMCAEENLKIIYEKRMPGMQATADNRTISELRRFSKVGENFDIRAQAKTAEPLLWLSDVIATAYRRKFVFGEFEYWNHVDEVASVSNF